MLLARRIETIIAFLAHPSIISKLARQMIIQEFKKYVSSQPLPGYWLTWLDNIDKNNLGQILCANMLINKYNDRAGLNENTTLLLEYLANYPVLHQLVSQFQHILLIKKSAICINPKKRFFQQTFSQAPCTEEDERQDRSEHIKTKRNPSP